MQDKPVIYIVGTKCPPELDEKFNNWYNGTHIPMLLESEHVAGATRYKLANVIEGESPTYLAIYEFRDRQALEAWYSCRERAVAIEEMNERWAEKGFETTFRAAYEPLKTWHK